MSFKNGDKSREHRLRRARIAQRDKVRQLRNTAPKKAAAKPHSK
jgi:hypothetical protein